MVSARWSTAQVVESLPSAYPRQEGLTCGEANAVVAIESFGISYQAPSNPGPMVRLFGYSLLGDLNSLLEAHGLTAPVRSAARMDDDERIELLRSHLREGLPVILAIGNGHLARGRYIAALRLVVGHYLTLYGFDDDSETFFVYDPYLQGPPDEPLPAGNEQRSYAEILRDWRGPLYYPLIGRRHAYIPVGRQIVDETNR